MSTKTSISFLKGRRSFSSQFARRLIVANLILLLLPALASNVLAQVKNDRIITYQAQILKAGKLVTDGQYRITASLYHDADAKTLLWRATYSTDVTNGIANLNLGEVRNGGVLLPESGLDGPLYLGISVGSNSKGSRKWEKR